MSTISAQSADRSIGTCSEPTRCPNECAQILLAFVHTCREWAPSPCVLEYVRKYWADKDEQNAKWVHCVVYARDI